MLTNRLFPIQDGIKRSGPVVYWMSRDQRAMDNWALIYGQGEAQARGVPLVVVFCLVDQFLDATPVQYAFMLSGIKEVRMKLKEYRIPLYVLIGLPENRLPRFVNEIDASLLITDFHPLNPQIGWNQKVAEHIQIPFVEVDTHNVIPCRIVSSKQEYGAYTLRPKIKRMLEDYLVDIPSLEKQNSDMMIPDQFVKYEQETNAVLQSKRVRKIPNAGSAAGYRRLHAFLEKGIARYHLRNDPMSDATSRLSPYIHFGQISAQRIAFEVKGNLQNEGSEFLEELIVRRELADNYCLYCQAYDRVTGFPQWAYRTLDEHRGDPRPYLYDEDTLENSLTHDLLWNAAQSEMVLTGYMPGYLRMYWAKKILEWTDSPEKAMEICIRMNNRYQLDGRDPNGYAGIAWSIGGVHDRAWASRPVFGKIRYMSYDGCRRKFDVDKYIDYVGTLSVT